MVFHVLFAPPRAPTECMQPVWDPRGRVLLVAGDTEGHIALWDVDRLISPPVGTAAAAAGPQSPGRKDLGRRRGMRGMARADGGGETDSDNGPTPAAGAEEGEDESEGEGGLDGRGGGGGEHGGVYVFRPHLNTVSALLFDRRFPDTVRRRRRVVAASWRGRPAC